MVVRAAIFLNPNSGSMSWEQKLKRAKVAAKRLEGLFNNVVVDKIFDNMTSSRQEFCDQLREESKGRGIVVAGGGDGTFGDALNYADARCMLGYIPLGSGNNIQTAMFLHRLRANLPVVYTDLIVDEADGKKSLFCGAGADGYFMNQSDMYRKKGLRGNLRYVPSLFDTARFRGVDMEVDIGGVKAEHKSARMVYIAKYPVIAKCVPLLPGANFDDGQLHCKVLNHWYIPGKKRSGDEIKVQFAEPVYVERDGEVAGKRTSLHVHIEKKARRLLTARL